MKASRKLPIVIKPQPDDITCGPTSLHAVYNYLGLEVSLDDVINSVSSLEEGGTLAVFLGLDALRRGFQATIYSYNLRVFDPTWKDYSREQLIDKLDKQLEFKKTKKLNLAITAYKSFLEKGGRILFDDLSIDLIRCYLSMGYPVLTGLSATYLYQCPREVAASKKKSLYDDIRGEPVGHFVVLCGFKNKTIYVADPLSENYLARDHYYKIPAARLLNAILLGSLTYDANLLVVGI